VNPDHVVLQVMRELEIDINGVDEGTSLRDDLGVDSTELVELAVAIERRAAVKLDTEEVLAHKTIGDLVTYVDTTRRR